MNRTLPPSPNLHAALGATASLVTLIALSIAWEAWLAPLRPGGSALVLTAVPLLLALPHAGEAQSEHAAP